jgi:beta-mannosidase
VLRRIALAGWSFRPASARDLPGRVAAAFADGAELQAVVPGNVHDDLLAHGLLADPYQGSAEAASHWVGREDWRYRTRLPDWPHDCQRVDLVAEGLDTAATVRLGDQVVATTRNQHRRHRWEIASRARPGDWLTVEFESVYRLAARAEAAWGKYPAAYDEPFPLVRKMASNFGWDWGPTVVTAGVWRPIRLEAWSRARLAAVRPTASLESAAGDRGRLELTVELERTAEGESVAGRTVDGGAAVVNGAAERGTTAVGRAAGRWPTAVAGAAERRPVVVTAVLADPDGGECWRGRQTVTDDQACFQAELGVVRRWWPHDLGEQPLYRLTVELADDTGLLDASVQQLGFRHIALATAPDQTGQAFGLTVAGQPVFVKGFNWIPADLLASRTTAADCHERLLDAKQAGANLVRVWGGGLFESDDFYQACDQLGLMVWQDCLFACAAYPEADEFADEIAAELRDNILRLAPHPSLALWNGGNETIWGQRDWGWDEVLEGRGWGGRYYYDLLPKLIGQLDPGRPYWPGSPYSGDPERHPNDPDYGCNHSWEVWNQADYGAYANDRPRFMAEFGYCAPAAWATLEAAVGAEHLRPWDSVLMGHYKAQEGEAKLRRAIESAFHPPADFAGWHYASQVQQARAVGFGLDYWRSLWPHCQGAVVWQLNDCWPAISWSAVDSAGRRKPVWHTVRRSFATRLALVLAAPDGGGHVLHLVNNSSEPWSARPLVARLGLDGQTRARWSQSLTVPAGQVLSVPLPLEVAPAPGPGELPGRGLAGDEILLVEADARAPDPAGRRVLARPDRQLELCPADFMVETSPDPAGARLQVTARSLVRDLLLQADRLGAVADAGPVTLLPGETWECLVQGAGRDLAPADFAPPVLLDAATVELAARAAQS